MKLKFIENEQEKKKKNAGLKNYDRQIVLLHVKNDRKQF